MVDYEFATKCLFDVSNSALLIVCEYCKKNDFDIYDYLVNILENDNLSCNLEYLLKAGAYAFDNNKTVTDYTKFELLMEYADVCPAMDDGNVLDFLRTCRCEIYAHLLLFLTIGHWARREKLIVISTGGGDI